MVVAAAMNCDIENFSQVTQTPRSVVAVCGLCRAVELNGCGSEVGKRLPYCVSSYS